MDGILKIFLINVHFYGSVNM